MSRPSPIVGWIARMAIRLFYRVDRVGDVPASGAVMLLPNHPNALLDPALIWTTSGRDVRFLAKSPLFEGLLRPLVVGSGAIPVYRRHDEGADVSKNHEAFAAVDAALTEGDAICLFPEGISHSTGRLVPLRTGAARMALSAEGGGARVALVAVGLNFERKTAFRSRVTIVYGQPFTCADLAANLAEDGAAEHMTAVRGLTDRIASHMRRLLVEADPGADAALVERVDRLYAAARGRVTAASGHASGAADSSARSRDAEDRVARRRAIAVGVQRLRVADPARYDNILMQVRRYDDRLGRFGLRDRHLDWQVPASGAARFAVRESSIALVLLPLAIAAMIVFYIPYRLTGLAARWFTGEPDVAATAKVVGGAIVYAAWFVALAAAAWGLAGGRAALLLLTLLPAMAVAGLFAIERESAVMDAVRAWFVLRRTAPGTRERLRRRRSELADLLDEVNEWLAMEKAGAL